MGCGIRDPYPLHSLRCRRIHSVSFGNPVVSCSNPFFLPCRFATGTVIYVAFYLFLFAPFAIYFAWCCYRLRRVLFLHSSAQVAPSSSAISNGDNATVTSPHQSLQSQPSSAGHQQDAFARKIIKLGLLNTLCCFILLICLINLAIFVRNPETGTAVAWITCLFFVRGSAQLWAFLMLV